jgi:DNA-binding MarR family transcriptional regulator
MNRDTQEISQKIVHIVPSIMRTLSITLRTSQHKILPSQYGILKRIAHARRNLSELAETETVTLPTMSNSISTLVDRGWLSRDIASDDRREIMLTITPKGLAVIDEIEQHVENRLGGILQTLQENDFTRLSEGLDVLEKVFCLTNESNTSIDKRNCK